MTNSSVLLGKRKRHQLLNQQNENIRLLNNTQENTVHISNNSKDGNESITTTSNPITNQYIVDNIPSMRFTESDFPELWDKIFSYLKLSHIYELSVVCRTFNSIIHRHSLWIQIVDKIPKLKRQWMKRNNGIEYNSININNSDQTDVMKMITMNRKQICEECFKRIDEIGSKSILPMYIKYERRKIYLCLTCRQQYCIKHCNDIEDVEEFEKVYNVHENYLPKYVAEDYYLLNGSDLEPLHHFETRNPHGRGLHYLHLYHYTDILIAARRKYGGAVGFLAQLEKVSNNRNQRNKMNNGRKKKSALSYEESEKKKTILQNHLKVYGFHIPLGMKSVNRFIEYGYGSALDIVESIRQLDWYNRCTNYDDIMRQNLSEDLTNRKVDYFKHVDSIKAEKLAKRKALGDWLINRFKQHQYQPTSSWVATTNDFPPKSLWEEIDSIWKAEFINYAISLLPSEVSDVLKNSIKKRHRTSDLAINILQYHLNKFQIPLTRPLGNTNDKATNIGKVLRLHFGKTIYEDIAKAF